ncbi:MAG: hypothetical protein Q7J34_09170 [Bacteroidales bacterium]|nr:hypothetical protein [Bacteroidales bacterium]
MKKPLGIVLIVVGAIMLAYTGFNYVTTEKVVDLGPIEINAEKSHTLQWPPFIGFVLIAGGAYAILHDKKKSSPD